MNLSAIVMGAIAAVNPLFAITVQVSTGSTIGPDGKRTPSYAAPVSAQAQLQPLSTGDIRHFDMLNIQGDFKKLYILGEIDGLVRSKNKGGDLVTFVTTGQVWLVSEIAEDWMPTAGWTCAYITLQNS